MTSETTSLSFDCVNIQKNRREKNFSPQAHFRVPAVQSHWILPTNMADFLVLISFYIMGMQQFVRKVTERLAKEFPVKSLYICIFM